MAFIPGNPGVLAALREARRVSLYMGRHAAKGNLPVALGGNALQRARSRKKRRSNRREIAANAGLWHWKTVVIPAIPAYAVAGGRFVEENTRRISAI